MIFALSHLLNESPDFYPCSRRIQASSSIGRASVSKTEGWGFDALLACQDKESPLKNLQSHAYFPMEAKCHNAINIIESRLMRRDC